jgi:hypothetical protein
MTNRTLITRVEDIPESFPSEDDEREWWATHDLSDDVIDQLQDGVEEAARDLKRFQQEYFRAHPGNKRSAS